MVQTMLRVCGWKCDYHSNKRIIIIFYEEGLLSDWCPHYCMFTPLVVCHGGTLLLAASECAVWSLGGGGGEHGPHALRDGQGHAVPTEVSRARYYVRTPAESG